MSLIQCIGCFETAIMNLDNLRLNSTHNPENLHISHIFLNESERKRNLNLEK